jgi:hypothetical protein
VEEAKALLAHALPRADLAEIHLRAIRTLVAELKKRKFATSTKRTTEKAATELPDSVPSAHVAASSRAEAVASIEARPLPRFVPAERHQRDSELPRQRDSELPRQRDSDLPRQRDSEPPRQRDSEPPRQRDSEPPRQRDSEPPRQRDSELPRQRDSELPRQRDCELPRRRDAELPHRRDSEPPRQRDLEPPQQRDSEAPRQRNRYLPAAVRRAVFERDGNRCAYVDERGERCREISRLEFQHHEAFAHGGPATLDNLSLYCAAHNTLAAEQDFGLEIATTEREHLHFTERMISQTDAPLYTATPLRE